MQEYDETNAQDETLDTTELRRPRHFDWIRTAGMLAVLGLFALVTLQFTPFWPAPENHAGVGEKLPEIDLQPLTGESGPVSTGDLEGKVVLLNFWGTWCPPCRQEAPHVDALYETFRENDGFRLLSVSCSGDPAGEPDVETLRQETTAFLQSQQLSFPTFADVNGKTRAAVAQTAGFDGYPTTILLDGQGIIRRVWVGYSPGVEKQMEAAIRVYLER
ncbi:hypothetical protein JCM19992_03810 [Thermostilla marina]